MDENEKLRAQVEAARRHLKTVGAMPVLQLEKRRADLERQIEDRTRAFEREHTEASTALGEAVQRLKSVRATIVQTQEEALLQEVGIYRYRHPLTDAVAYRRELESLEAKIKEMAREDGKAVLAATDWTVNGSPVEGRKMVRDISKLMLRAFNAEADNLVRGLKPYKLDRALERMRKVADTIERLGKTMMIRISDNYYAVRARELELTADYLQKQAEEKEATRVEKERLKEERKALQELERERERLDKERRHFVNALDSMVAKGDLEGAVRLREQLSDVEKAIETVDYRTANVRAGYVYVISNIGSFGESMVKVGMTRRLDPLDRIRELSDASVPFNFDVHALFFSKDAVGIEAAAHERLAGARVNLVNRRREFFRATPNEVKAHLSELAGELLEFHEIADAVEYRQSVNLRGSGASVEEAA
jgi:hypothetical protein